MRKIVQCHKINLSHFICVHLFCVACFISQLSTLFTFNMDKYKSSDRVKHRWLSINKFSFIVDVQWAFLFDSVQRGIVAKVNIEDCQCYSWKWLGDDTFYGWVDKKIIYCCSKKKDFCQAFHRFSLFLKFAAITHDINFFF